VIFSPFAKPLDDRIAGGPGGDVQALRMGTPLEINVPSVRVNRATAIFRIRMPRTGSFRTIVSSTKRPCGVPYQTFRPKRAPPKATRMSKPKILPMKYSAQ